MTFVDTTDNLVKLAVAHLATLGYADVSVCDNDDINGKFVGPPPAEPNRHWYLGIAGTDCEYVDEPGIDLILIRPKNKDMDDQIDLRDFEHLERLLSEEGYLEPPQMYAVQRDGLEGGTDVIVARSHAAAYEAATKRWPNERAHVMRICTGAAEVARLASLCTKP